MKKITIATSSEIQPIVTHDGNMEQIKKPVVAGATADQCNVNYFELGPGIGNTNNVYHYHAKSEEVFYIIRGNGYIRTPEGDRKIAEGDIIICPAHPESAHNICNASDTEKLIYMNVATAHKPDVMFVPDEHRGFILDKEQVIPFEMK